MFGQSKFLPSFVKTDEEEFQNIMKFLDADFLRGLTGIDPFCGTRTIEEALNTRGILNFQSNDVNPMLHDNHSTTMHLDALQPKVLLQWLREGFKYCFTSPPFVMFDVLLPLYLHTFEICILHCAPGFISNAPVARRHLMRKLAEEKRVWYFSTDQARNSEFHRFTQWLVIVKDPSVMKQLITRNAQNSIIPMTIQLNY